MENSGEELHDYRLDCHSEHSCIQAAPPSPLKAMEPSIYAVLHAPLQSQLSLLKMEPHLENVVPFGSILNSFFFLPMRCLLSLLLSFAQSP